MGLSSDNLPAIRISLDTRRAEDASTLATGPVLVDDATVTTGGRAVDVRVYRGGKGGKPPVLVYVHSGGYVLGNLDTDHRRCVDLARLAGCVIVSVDYRLAPEAPHPAGLDDCMTVLDEVLDHPERFGVDADRVAIGGSSAGAGMTAALAQRVRDERGDGVLRLQLMHQPMLDRRCSTPSMREFEGTPYFDAHSARAAWEMYVGDGADRPYLAAADATSLAGLAPAYVSCSEVDPLRDEAIDYARRLVEHGVPTELHLYPATCHGFDSVAPEAPLAVTVAAEQADALRRAFA